MAPPRHRRPGFSRRAQYGLFAGYVIAVVGIIGGLGLVLIAHFDPNGFNALRGVAGDATAPVSSVGRAAVRGVSAVGENVGAYWRAGSKNKALRDEMETARANLVEARAIDFENRRLKRLLRVVEAAPETIVVTRVVGSSASSPRRLAILAAGASSGVRPGQPVRSAEGLVGRVVETGQTSARVLLLTDSGNTIPVRLARSGTPALATGHGDGRIEVRALIAGAAPFRRGDIVMTSGTGGVYPPNIPVAVITGVDRDIATGWPLADPAKLDFAIVLKAFEPDIPARPAAAAR